MRSVRLAKIRRLFGKAAKGDREALVQIRHTTEALMHAASDVIGNWASGDLAGAVNALREDLECAEGR